jgi:hypothetical protein
MAAFLASPTPVGHRSQQVTSGDVSRIVPTPYRSPRMWHRDASELPAGWGVPDRTDERLDATVLRCHD